MTNEEKAKKIAMPCPACSCLWTKDMMYKQEYCKDCVPQDRFTGAMEMAQWKDEHIKQLIHYADVMYYEIMFSGCGERLRNTMEEYKKFKFKVSCQ